MQIEEYMSKLLSGIYMNEFKDGLIANQCLIRRHRNFLGRLAHTEEKYGRHHNEHRGHVSTVANET
jgi:hypothetical protein